MAKQLRQGHALGKKPVDCGAMCMPGLAEKVGELVDEAVQKGAQVGSMASLSQACWPFQAERICLESYQTVSAQLSVPTPVPAELTTFMPEAKAQTHCLLCRYDPAYITSCLGQPALLLPCTNGCRGVQVLTGGKLISGEAGGQFYAPTVLVGVTPSMRIWKEEVFGPVMVIVKCGSDDEAVRLANDCPFGLGSAVFSRSAARARSIGARLEVSCCTIHTNRNLAALPP